MENSQQKYKVLLENSVSAILFTKPDGSIVEVNEAAQEMFGYSHQEFIGLQRKYIVDVTDENHKKLMAERAVKGKIKGELIGIRKNGEKFPIRFTSALFIDEGEERYCTTVQDISERKKSEHEMALMIDNTEESFILLDTKLCIISFNRQFENLCKTYFDFTIQKEALIFDYAQPDRKPALKELYARVLKGATEKSNLTIPIIDGTIKHFVLTYSPTKDENESITGVFVTARDVTEETENQLAIKETKAELDKIMNSSLDVICTIDVEGNFVKVSNASKKVWGYIPEELVGKKYIDYVHPDDLEKTKIASLEIIAGFDQTNFQNRYIKKDGTIVPIIWSAKWDDTEKIMFCIAKDGTEKAKQEAALIESEKLYKNLFENSPAPMLIFDFETLHIIDCNEETLLKYGYTKDEFLKLTIKDIRPPEDIEKIEQAVANEATYGQIHKNIWRHQKKNGEIMFMDISAHLINYQGRRMSFAILIDITEKLKIEEQKEFEKRDKEALINSTDDLIWSVSRKFKLIAANQAYVEKIQTLTGVTVKTGDDILMSTVFPKELIEFWSACYTRVLAGESFQEEVKTPPTENSEETWADITFNPIYKEGEVVGIACYARNITENKKALSILKDRESKLRAAQHIAKLGYWERNIETGDLFWSSEVYKIWGINKNTKPNFELFTSTIHPDDIEAFMAEQSAVLLGEKEMDFEHRIVLKDGSIKWVHEKGKLQKEGHEKIISLDGTVQDITERKKTEEKLKESIQRYENVTKATSDAIWDWDLVNNVTYRAEGFKTSFGFDLEILNAPDTKWENYIHPEDEPLATQNIYDTINSNENYWKHEYRIIKPDGQIAFVQDNAFFIRDENNKVVRIIGALKDITERKETELAIRKSHERFELIGKAANDAIWEWDFITNKGWANATHQQLFGLTLEDLVPERAEWIGRLHPKESEKILQSFEETVKAKRDIFYAEYQLKIEDKGWISVSDRTYIEYNATGDVVRKIGSMSDITQRKQEEQQYKLMSSVVTNTSDAVLITEAEPFDQPGPKIIYVNDAFTKMTGYTAEEVIGKTPRILQGPKSDRRELARLRKALENWESCEITTINYKKNGEEFWINFSVSPVADEKGWFTHWMAIERDVTLRKNEELQNELIADISTVFNEPIQLYETFDKTLRHITAFGGFCFAEAWLTGRDRNIIHKVSTHATTDNMKLFLEETNGIDTSIEGEGLAGIVAQTKEIIIWGDLANQKRLRRRESALKYGLKTVMGLPMLHNNEVIGVLVFGLEFEVLNTAKYLTLFNALTTYLAPEIKRKQVEQELNQLFNFAPDIIVIVGLDGYFKRINPAACKMLGYTQEELCSIPYMNFVHPDDKNITDDEIEIVLENNHTFYFENRYITKSGKIKWLTWNATYSKEENNIYAVAKDITEKKELEDLLQKANDLARIGGWEVDLQNNTVFWSGITKEIHEVASDYVPDLKTGITFYKKGKHRKGISNYIKQAYKNGTSWDDEFQIITAKGNERWVRVIGEVEKVNGSYNRVYGSFQDIDERKKAESKLIENENYLRTILDNEPECVKVLNRKGELLSMNPAGLAMIEADNEQQVLGQRMTDLVNKNYQIGFNRLSKEVFKGNSGTFEFEITGLKGSQRWLETHAVPLKDATGKIVNLLGVTRDITERKKAYEVIRSTEERRKLIMNAALDAIICIDDKGMITFWNPQAEHIFGWRESEVIGKLLSSIIIPETYRILHDKGMKNYLKTGHGPALNVLLQLRAKRHNGEEFPIELTVLPLQQDGEQFFCAFIRDITERKTYETRLIVLNESLEKQKAALVVSNHELEQFAYIASHDLQEPLRMVTSFLTLLNKKYGANFDETATSYIDFAIDGAKRMRQLILDLLEYSRVGKSEEATESIDLNSLIAEIKILHRKQIEEMNASIIIEDTLPLVKSHKSPLLQLFQNLISNALKYSRKDVTPVVKISFTSLNDYWQFVIEDNGIGIDEEYFDKIFIIFQRLHNKDEYSGTGMGLAVTKKIVESLGGKIWLESIVDTGTKFYFTIPKK